MHFKYSIPKKQPARSKKGALYRKKRGTTSYAHSLEASTFSRKLRRCFLGADISLPAQWTSKPSLTLRAQSGGLITSATAKQPCSLTNCRLKRPPPFPKKS